MNGSVGVSVLAACVAACSRRPSAFCVLGWAVSGIAGALTLAAAFGGSAVRTRPVSTIVTACRLPRSCTRKARHERHRRAAAGGLGRRSTKGNALPSRRRSSDGYGGSGNRQEQTRRLRVNASSGLSAPLRVAKRQSGCRQDVRRTGFPLRRLRFTLPQRVVTQQCRKRKAHE
jgi:hypothetical protein